MGEGVGVYMVKNMREELYHAMRLNFRVINNEAEYEVVLVGLAIAKASRGEEVEMKADLEVVVKRISEKRSYINKVPPSGSKKLQALQAFSN